MADNLPEPASRKESYLAKAAGMDVTIPEKPESRVEQYLEAIAEGGGGGGTSYTAGDGITIADDTISVDTTTIQEKLTAGTGIDITNNTISATGGSGPTVVQTTGTSTTDVMSQNATTSMVFDDPATQSNIKIGERTTIFQPNGTVVIGSQASGRGNSVAIGQLANQGGTSHSVCIGKSTSAGQYSTSVGENATTGTSQYCVALGKGACTNNSHDYSVALGSYASCSRAGEVNIGTDILTYGYNSTPYRVLGGVHDPVDAHDAATKGYVDGLNVQPILESAFNDAGNHVSITLAQYQQIETACLNFRSLFYNESDIGFAHCVHIYEYECTQNAGINLYLPPTIGGTFSLDYNGGNPYAIFNVD